MKNREPLRVAPTQQELEEAAAAAAIQEASKNAPVTFEFEGVTYEVLAPSWRDLQNKIIHREELLSMPAEQERLIAIQSGVIRAVVVQEPATETGESDQPIVNQENPNP